MIYRTVCFEAKEPAINFDTIAKPNFESLSEDDKKIVSEAVEVRPQKPEEEGGGYRVTVRKPIPESVATGDCASRAGK